ncbi:MULTISPECIES: hypothetical protein [unclassified Methylophaga]|jgi:hypothetical protein|uniref:hypothetical protein n=1 Tax=unclassified Methylophaga TaxID=2629249 RepID=UPI000C8FD8E0|nr:MULTISPECIES: hypothetical protein [unclassified Methylophaga]MAK67650.1 hypothetical protein [Methylophaga sp.]MAY18884.1 hypothetical protein [Methylophaga sp.]MBN47767.1 hypothetical protein [Methylophaga sp.]HAO24468.1 hypothetical protein [Methylophaga sp.]HCD05126.1 hypothetical protein [Methylophaga sp.]|tara:strand:- start:32264 stop:32596 length:333 start_codon:yes stop_codon:yes gene_type:complete
MAIQFLPIIKAVAPYVAQVAAYAIPAFTAKPETVKADPVLVKQIEELQEAATQNAQSIHVLAENMQQAISGFETAAEQAKKQVATYRTLLFISFGLSTVAILICLYLLLR